MRRPRRIKTSSEKENSNTLNRIEVIGKVVERGVLKYTPSGLATCEFKVAIHQDLLGKKNMGYVECMMLEEMAVTLSKEIKVGQSLHIQGSLWTRKFKTETSKQISEFKILVNELKSI